MGYLANKKHLAFITTSLRTFLIVSTIITLISFGKNDYSQFLNEYRWQMYLLLAFAFLYTLIKKMPIFCILFFLLGAINFFCITSTTNLINFQPSAQSIKIFFDDNGNDPLRILDKINKTTPDIVAITNSDLNNFDISSMLTKNYTLLPQSNSKQKNLMLSKAEVKNSGRITLRKNFQIPFMIVEYQNLLITFITVDFSNFSYKEISAMLEKLSSFIAQQDNPVVIFGNFNNVAWSYQLSSFISQNGLVVKNSMLDNFRNLFILTEKSMHFSKSSSLFINHKP